MYNFVRGSRLFMKGAREGNDNDAAVDPGDQVATADGLGVLSHETRMSSSATERQESKRMVTKGGQKMVQSSRRVIRKTTTMTRGNHKTVTESVTTTEDALPLTESSHSSKKMITRHESGSKADRDISTQTQAHRVQRQEEPEYRKRLVRESSSSYKKQKVN